MRPSLTGLQFAGKKLLAVITNYFAASAHRPLRDSRFATKPRPLTDPGSIYAPHRPKCSPPFERLTSGSSVSSADRRFARLLMRNGAASAVSRRKVLRQAFLRRANRLAITGHNLLLASQSKNSSFTPFDMYPDHL